MGKLLAEKKINSSNCKNKNKWQKFMIHGKVTSLMLYWAKYIPHLYWFVYNCLNHCYQLSDARVGGGVLQSACIESPEAKATRHTHDQNHHQLCHTAYTQLCTARAFAYARWASKIYISLKKYKIYRSLYVQIYNTKRHDTPMAKKTLSAGQYCQTYLCTSYSLTQAR